MVRTPIETAKGWLKTAEVAFDAGIYEQSLYALEMSVEIALKAVLIATHVEVPKVHDITDVVRTFLVHNKKLPKEFADNIPDYLSTFKSLVEIRPFVGYGFENKNERIWFDKQAQELMPKCTKIVKSCENAIKKLG